MSTTFEDINTDKEWEGYEAPSDFNRPAEPGIYTFMRVTDEGTFKAWTSTNAETGETNVGYNFRATIVGGPYDGRLAFAGISTFPKTDFVTKKPIGNTVQNFILAAGKPKSFYPGKDFLVKEAEVAIAAFPANKPYLLEQAIGPFKARVDWEWRCKDCELTFLAGGSKPKVPKKYDGPKVGPVALLGDKKTVNHVQTCPGCSQPIGANLQIRKFFASGVEGASGGTKVTTAVPPPESAPAAG